MRSKILFACGPLLLLGACDTLHPSTGSTDPGFGEALKYDMAVQTIDPDPIYSDDDAQPGDNGDKGAQAVKRYRTGQVKQLEVMSTSSAGSSGPR